MTDVRFDKTKEGDDTNGPLMRVNLPVVDLCREPATAGNPQGGRDKQLEFGQAFQAIGSVLKPWVFGYDPTDGYVGYVSAFALEGWIEPTHRVGVRSCHVYSQPDFKSRELQSLSFGSQVSVTEGKDGYNALSTGGYMLDQHLVAVDHTFADPTDVAQMYLGTPYLWGGNSGFGIDCSGLVQHALSACGIDCPRDSDLQEAYFSSDVKEDDLQGGDLVFWKGHVGMMLDKTRLIHANAYHMMVAIEPFAQAKERIGKKEFGAVTAMKRI